MRIHGHKPLGEDAILGLSFLLHRPRTGQQALYGEGRRKLGGNPLAVRLCRTVYEKLETAEGKCRLHTVSNKVF
jgi:hypothetical protein